MTNAGEAAQTTGGAAEDGSMVISLRTLAAWVLPGASALLIGPAAAWLAGMLRDSAGGGEVTALLSQSPALGVASLLLAGAIAALVAMVGSRLVDMKLAMLCAGFVLAWVSIRMGTMEGIVRRAGGDLPAAALAAEGVLACVLAAVIAALAEGVRGTESKSLLAGTLARMKQGVTGTCALAAMGAAAVAALLAAWLIAREPTKGQALFAAGVAGIAAGAAGRLAWSGAGGDAKGEPPMLTMVLGVSIAAAVAPFLGAMIGPGEAIERVYANGLFRAANLIPTDWAAGALLGVCTGEVWARSSMKRHS
ncbi:MAG: hypothetical protein RBS39_11685 [Phycisphaerales bacterium]|jgi:hypothetical protein|nr:hypothetical protein [Phycisphaerales bacterium]